MKTEENFARQLCRVLDQGSQKLDRSITEKLRIGRERALQQRAVALDVALESAVASASSATLILGAGGTASQHGMGGMGSPWRTLFAILSLLLGMTLSYYWNGLNQATENEEIDSALLADDLPPNAYLDRGFQAWLEKHVSVGE